MPAPTVYELFAIKYATHERGAHENFVFRDVHDAPMPLDYYVWVARSAERTFVIDTGFSAETAARRGRQIIRNPRLKLVHDEAVGEPLPLPSQEQWKHALRRRR